MARRLLLVLPAVAALIVVWAVLTAGGPARVRAVQVLGGPTSARRELSLLLRAVDIDEGRATPVPHLALVVTALAPPLEVRWEGVTDAAGYVEAQLEFAHAPSASPTLRVESATGETLALGALALELETWRSGARREGGWLRGQTHGELAIRVAPAWGTLAVPFETDLIVSVTGAPERVALAVELEGAELLEPAPGSRARTDAFGLARLRLTPLEHAVSLRLQAETPTGARGEWYGALPVTPGALYARIDAQHLTLYSPVPRERGFVSLVSADARLAGGVVSLNPDETSGGASGQLELSPALLETLLSQPTWAVVSSEYDKRSPSVVGWPLMLPDFSRFEPPLTFDVADRLLVDGVSLALEAERQRRLTRRRTASLLLVAVGIAMSGLLLHELRRDRPRSTETGELALESRIGWIALAVACVLIGIGSLVFFGAVAR